MKQFFNQVQAEEESEINITPMLDVVFIMLIFFIVTATFVKEAGIDVNRRSLKLLRTSSRVALTSRRRTRPCGVSFSVLASGLSTITLLPSSVQN